jgi:hypothetical protein
MVQEGIECELMIGQRKENNRIVGESFFLAITPEQVIAALSSIPTEKFRNRPADHS